MTDCLRLAEPTPAGPLPGRAGAGGGRPAGSDHRLLTDEPGLIRALRRQLTAMLSTAQTDVLLVVSGAPTGLLLARVAGAAALAASGRGVRTRLLIEEAAVVRRAGRALVGAAAAAGAAIRATPAVPASLLRVDHSVALGVVDPDAPAGLIVLRDPEALRLLDAQFELAWRIGIQPAVGRRPEAGPDPVDLAVLDALASGRKDEVAARQLGLSVRSLRRRVAQLMARLGAASRFEAGVRAAERGWVTAGRP